MSDDIRDKIRIFQEVVQGKRPACELKAILPDEVPTKREINWMRFAIVDMFAAMSGTRIGGNVTSVDKGTVLHVGGGSGALEYVRETLYGFQRAANEATDFSEGLPGVGKSEQSSTPHDDGCYICRTGRVTPTASELNYGADKAQPPEGSFIRVSDSWTCDNHTDPITYTMGQESCEVCGRLKP